MSGPRLRADLAALPAYTPGRPARAGTSGSGVFGSSGPGHKLSSNENPYPPLPSVLRAVAGQAADLNRYPDMAAAELTTALASAFDIPTDHIAAVAGSIGVLPSATR